MGDSSGPVTLNIDQVNRHAAQLVERNTWSRERLTAYQNATLRESLLRAVEKSSYYANMLGSLVRRDAPLAEFPILTKRMLMANFDHILTNQHLNRESVEAHLVSPQVALPLLGKYRVAATGGTTGERGVVVYDELGWLSVIANIVRFQRLLGIAPRTRVLGIGAPSPIHLSNRFWAELRTGQTGAPELFVTMPIERVVQALNKYQPDVLLTYASFLRVLATEQQSGRLHISPIFVCSGAENLTQDVRDAARAAWNVSVINRYPSTEVGLMGQECEHTAGVHLAEDLTVYEVVDDNNRPVAPGVTGAKLLVTTLTNKILPLIRYELTDAVALAVTPCRCGLPFAQIASIEGRREEVLRFPRRGGGFVDVHAIRLRSPLIGTTGVCQFQLANSPEGLEISVTTLPVFDREAVRSGVERSIRKALEKLDIATVKVSVTVIDKIERVGSGAKEKIVVNPKPSVSPTDQR